MSKARTGGASPHFGDGRCADERDARLGHYGGGQPLGDGARIDRQLARHDGGGKAARVEDGFGVARIEVVKAPPVRRSR